MPTAATHITVVQRLALDPRMQKALGNPNAVEGDDDFELSRYANLGAVGPDILYTLGDFASYGPELQALENFLVKVAGTFQCLADQLEIISVEIEKIKNEAEKVVDFITGDLYKAIKKTLELFLDIFHEGLLVLAINPTPWGLGLSFFPIFEPPRQKDYPREKWFWADYLHYIRTGQFTQRLLELSKESGNDKLKAYALGYLTHYITDVVGHPYVNQNVQAPWRMYWQRHHLVENFIDAYVWPRWHLAVASSGPEEPPLDQLTSTPNDPQDGAPLTYARLNDFILVGGLTLDDPVAGMAQAVCEASAEIVSDVKKWAGIDDDPIEVKSPTDANFTAWTEMVTQAIQDVYPNSVRHPKNLGADGYPTPTDIGGAYGVFRLLLRLATEDKDIPEPEPPDFPDFPIDDIIEVVQAVEDAVAKALALLPALVGNISLTDLLAAIGAFAAALVAAVVEAVEAVIALIDYANEAATYLVRYGLYYLQRLLYAVYRALRQVLVVNAYVMPRTDELYMKHGEFAAAELWQSQGNIAQVYPWEEQLSERFEHEDLPFPANLFDNSYSPIVPPTKIPSAKWEKPAFGSMGPYAFGSSPDAFVGDLTATTGPDNLFSVTTPKEALDPRWEGNFGGAIENCRKALEVIIPALETPGPFSLPTSFALPDYNLDGDRRYGWPCWDVSPEVIAGGPKFGEPVYDDYVKEPLRSDDPRNAPFVEVNAVEVNS